MADTFDDTLVTLLQELMADFDDTIDTSEGSAFYTQVIVPFLTRIGGSPLEVDLETLLKALLLEEIPDIDVSPLSGIVDLGVKANIAMFRPLLRELTATKTAQSLSNFASMTRDEVDALLANYFISLRSGDKAATTARIFYPAPQSVIVTPLTQFSTGGGLNFFPTTTQSISSTVMSFNQDGNLYYFDVIVEAEEVGDQYNIDAGDLNSVTGLSGVQRVTNLFDVDDAENEETKEEGITRAQESITIRNLSTTRGIKVVTTENFSTIAVVQPIGHGDPEMRRDIIYGPVQISGIPGGIVGKDLPDVGAGQFVHIGGHTDVYVYQNAPVADTLDIQNLSDWGIRVFAGSHGFTQSGGGTFTFEDNRGNFSRNGVVAGDFLRVGEVLTLITNVSLTALEVSDTLDGGLAGQDYEVVRFDAGGNLIEVPLYDLVAESDGVGVTDDDGDPVQSIPGDIDKGSLLDSSSDPVKKLQNIAENNVQLPLTRVESVEFLDPLTLESLGISIPMKDVLLAVAHGAFSGGDVVAVATGTIRLYFRDALSAWVTSASTLFEVGTLDFRPADDISVEILSVDDGADTITVSGDHTGTGTDDIQPGYRITSDGQVWTVTAVTETAGDTLVALREDFTAGEITTGTGRLVHVGVREADMVQDTVTGLYIWDVSSVAGQSGTASNLEDGTEFSTRRVNSEGWSLRTTESVLSYSTKELPYFQITNWVNDTTQLSDELVDFAVRLNYDHVADLPDIQDFVEDDDNRIIAEDILVKHFQPAYVRGAYSIEGATAEDAQTTLIAYVNDLDPTAALEVSDTVVELEKQVGATHVLLPVTLIALVQDADRDWSALIDQDTLGSNRIQHFIADEDFLTVSVLT